MINTTSKLQGFSIIRVIAAFSVLFGHVWQFGDWGALQPVRLPEIYTPVNTFFVITGFLLAWGFLQEYAHTGGVDIKASYKRRAIRILPLYYIGIGVGFLALWLCGDTMEGNPTALLLLQSEISHVFGTTPFPLWHYWFLGVEVLFYLLFPLLFCISRKCLIPTIGGCAIGWMLLKWTVYIVCGKGLVYKFIAIASLDVLLLGSTAAILFYERRTWLISLCSPLWFAIVSWLLFLSTNLWVDKLPSPVRSVLIAVISLMVILSAVCSHPLFENKITQYLSKLTYGIYIFHPIVIYVAAHFAARHFDTSESPLCGYLAVLAVVAITIGLAVFFQQVLASLHRRGT